MKNDGKAAEEAFFKHWQGVGHVERLRDKKDLMGLNKNMRLADFAKPADFLVSSRHGPLHYAEVKSTTHPTRFSFADIRPAQSAAALKEARWGHGAYWFYIYSYATGHWYLLSCAAYADLLNDGLRSIKFEEMHRWNDIK